MHPRGPSAALLLALLILTMGLVAGCGGGEQSEDQPGNGSQDGGQGKAQKQGGGEGTSQRGAPVPKIAVGTVARVDTEKSKIVVRPTSPEEGKKPIPFKVKPKATITLDDQEAELADAEKGQGAQITYVVKDDRNLAREVTLLSPEGAAAAGGEESG